MFSAIRKRGVHLHGGQHRSGSAEAIRRQLRGGVIASLGVLAILMTLAGAAGAVSLPDGRGYELVSPGGQEVYSPENTRPIEEDIRTELPFRAAATGEAVAYVGDPPASLTEGNGNTGNGGGNSYVATRSPAGWSSKDVMPTTVGGNYVDFSAGLEDGVLSYVNFPPSFPALTASVGENASLRGCSVLYERQVPVGSTQALFEETQSPEFCGEEGEPLFAGANEGAAGASPFSDLLIQTMADLTPGGEESEFGKFNLYERANGKLNPINILAGSPAPNATFGAPSLEGPAANFSHDISADGSRIVWTDLNTGPTDPNAGRIFLHEGEATNLPVSEGAARYWTATADDSLIYYVENGALWTYDAAKHERTELAGEGTEGEPANVEGVVGADENAGDGPDVYFVATQVLTNNANALGEHASAGQPNLYLDSGAVTSFIATLSVEDDEISEGIGGNHLGDWQVSPAYRTAEVDQNASAVAFLSRQPLTGYDNEEQRPGRSPVHVPELFVYEAASHSLYCASCDPSGAPPADEVEEQGGALVPVSFNANYMPHWLSSDGDKVFFDTPEPLASTDTNGRQDVYEWEVGKAGSCPVSSITGCLSVLSGGTGTDWSYLVDASSSGSNVFFTTRTRLLPSDQNDLTDLYDARVGGGFSEVSSGCTGAACEASSAEPQAPPPVTTSLVAPNGNFPPSTGSPPHRPSVAELRARKLAGALKACRKKKIRAKRRVCERGARARYGAAHKQKSKKARKSSGKASKRGEGQ